MQAIQDFLTNLLANFDLSEIDLLDISLYLGFLAGFLGFIYGSIKWGLSLFWERVKGPVGFAINTLVLVSIWYAWLRIELSLSVNSNEFYDDQLFWSGIFFTPYYLVQYQLLERVFILVGYAFELIFDAASFPFGDSAKKREKWVGRLSGGISSVSNQVIGLFEPTEEVL